MNNLKRAKMLFNQEHSKAMAAFRCSLHSCADFVPGRLKNLIRDSEYHGRRSERLARYIESHECV